MRLVTPNRKAVREALAQEGWRFALANSLAEFKRHQDSCRKLWLPTGSESDNRVRSIRERVLRSLPWELRGQSLPRWLSYVSKSARKRLQPNMPIAADFCLIHGFIFLVGEVWGERRGGVWRLHRTDGPAVVIKDQELYFWYGWQVSKETVLDPPTAERIIAEQNQTEREVLLQRMGVETFVREASLEPVDSFRDSVLLKVNTAQKQHRWNGNESVEEPVSLTFIKVVCPSTQHVHFLRVEPQVASAKQALESTLPGFTRDWQKDLVAET